MSGEKFFRSELRVSEFFVMRKILTLYIEKITRVLTEDTVASRHNYFLVIYFCDEKNHENAQTAKKRSACSVMTSAIFPGYMSRMLVKAKINEIFAIKARNKSVENIKDIPT